MLTLVAAVLFAIATPEQDGLLSYTAPTYSLRDKGTVELRVDVDARGNVTAVRPTKPSPILNTFAIDAVKKWKFAPGRPRVETVTISFDGERESDCETAPAATYESPFMLHVKSSAAKTHCERHECALHHEPMTVERVPILYGMPMVSDDDRQYFAARDAEFPNARSATLGGCVAGPERFAEVYVCESCRRAKERWLLAHPRSKPLF
jgi:TonB family protein